MPDPTKPITPEATPTPAAPPSNTGSAEKPRRGAEIVPDAIPYDGPAPHPRFQDGEWRAA